MTLAPNAGSQHWLVAIDGKYMAKIIQGEKNHEFRKYAMNDVLCIWFYQTKPGKGEQVEEGASQHITHVCVIDEATNRQSENWKKLPTKGDGNVEYNEETSRFTGYDHAFRIKKVYKLKTPISKEEMLTDHGIHPPQGRMRLPSSISAQHPYNEQNLVIEHEYVDLA